MPAETLCPRSVGVEGPGQPSVQGKAATPNDANPATINDAAARRFRLGANARQAPPNVTIPVDTIHLFSAPSSANRLIASFTGSYPCRSAPAITHDVMNVVGPTSPAT